MALLFAFAFGEMLLGSACAVSGGTPPQSLAAGAGPCGGPPSGGDADVPGPGFCGAFPSIAPRPTFGATIQATTPPPPISGGTLLVTRKGTVVASDPDRDAVYVVDPAAMTLLFAIALQAGDEPGRLAEDGAGQVHVALRGGGALVTLNPDTGVVVARRAVCPAPRGLAWEASTDLVWVACATGELVAFPAAGGVAVHSFVVERDLRDIVVQSGQLTITKFRAAEVLRVAESGVTVRRDQLSAPQGTLPHVAWRTIAGPLPGTTVTVHQVESTQSIDTHRPGGYGGGGGFSGGLDMDASIGFAGSSGGGSGGFGGTFGPNGPSGPLPGIDLEAGVPTDSDGGAAADPSTSPTMPVPGMSPLPQFGPGPIVTSAVTVLDAAGNPLGSAFVDQGVLPVDIALSKDGTFVAVALAGNQFTNLPDLQIISLDASRAAALPILSLSGEQVTAVAFDAQGDLLAQTREPAQLLLVSGTQALRALRLSQKSREDTGHDVFHTQAGGLMACASCHPEGGDDGHTWLLDSEQRRTPSLRGTIAGTAPYHWPGDEKDMNVLLDDVYTGRMSGAKLDPGQQTVLTSWVESIPAPPAPSWIDHAATVRGKALFESAATGCKTCHSGSKLTNNATLDVGTSHVVTVGADGGSSTNAFQVPPLVGVGWRTPLFHDGCAATILDRFGQCATAGHGSTSQLSKQDVADLTAYLETL